ncbi:MAG: prenyltransferase [Lachnospiraceae bacterium]|nr:prenyltransferase [Lachnospiraceae bacterium]
MQRHSFKEWVAATRYWSFPVSAMPVIVTFAYLLSRNILPVEWRSLVLFLLSVLGVIILHAAGNLLSDWADYRSGVDNENAFAVPNLVFGQFQPAEYLRMSIILFVAGCLCGAGIVLLSGPAVLLIGGIGVVLTLLYSFLKYHALGDLDIFLIFGVLTVLGTTAVVCGDVLWDALVLSVPLGIITVSVLHANNTVDIESDRAAGIKTFAMLIGGKASSILYRVYMLLPFACIVLSVILGWLHPLALLCLPALVQAWKNFKQAAQFRNKGIEAMKGLDQSTAKLQLIFSTLLSAGLLIAGLI